MFQAADGEVTSRAQRRDGQTLVHGLSDSNAEQQTAVLTAPLSALIRADERRFELRDLAVELFFNRAFGVPPMLLALRSTQV